MKVKVKSAAVTEEVNRKTGDIYRQQWAFADIDGVEHPFKVSLNKAQPFAPGDYFLSSRGFATNEYDKLVMKFVELDPVPAAAAAVK